MPNHILGCHWMRQHQDNEDMLHIAKMGYKSYTLFEWMWDNKDFCQELVRVARPDAIFLLRDHPLSEQKADFVAHPATTGKRHAEEWDQKWDKGIIHLPPERCYHLGINEPNSNYEQREIESYNLAFIDVLAEYGLLAAAYSFGVGHPSTKNLQEKEKPDWSWYKDSADLLIANHGIAAIHEYWAPDNFGWGYWSLRIEHCPYPLTFVVQECGIDSGVLGDFPIEWEDEHGKKHKMNAGYQYYLPPDRWHEFVGQIDIYQARMSLDPRVHSVQPFTYDCGNWKTFDVRQIRHLLESYPWTAPQPLVPNNVTHIPSVLSSGPTELSNGKLIMPMQGTVTQEWGQNPDDYKRFGIPGHNGLDIAAAEGTPVVAVASGTVQFVDTDENYGNYVRIYHPDHGFHSFYAHLQHATVRVGEYVTQGQPIGQCGSTGNSTGPHLHYETRLGKTGNEYAKGTHGYGKGRVDPRVVHYMVNRHD